MVGSRESGNAKDAPPVKAGWESDDRALEARRECDAPAVEARRLADGDSAAAEGNASDGSRARRAPMRAGGLHSVGAVMFLAIVAVVLLVPSIGMIWAPTESTTENRVLADPPALFEEDGAFNKEVLEDAGAYFEDHFALRNQMVTANAFIRAAFASPSGDQVVVGSDGWLYYAATLDDYLGRKPLSNRALRNIAHNLSIMQGYTQYQGASFVFTIAPNKNSLYAQNMPYYYVKSASAGNAERLKPFLAQAGVNYLDLFEVLRGESDVLYLSRDTHWNNLGALVATNALLQQVGRPGIGLNAAEALSRDDFVGDVEGMQYPAALRTEPNYYFEGYNDGEGMSGSRWEYVEGSDVTQDWIETKAVEAGSGTSLLMFRDSFANALIPYWASLYDRAAFSKLIPYDVGTASRVGADTVIVERAERHLPYLAENPPLMPSPGVSLASLPAGDDPRGENTTLSVSRDGSYLVLSGTVDERVMAEESSIYVVVDRHDGAPLVFDAFWTSRGVDGSAADAQTDVQADAQADAQSGVQADAKSGAAGGQAGASGAAQDEAAGVQPGSSGDSKAEAGATNGTSSETAAAVESTALPTDWGYRVNLDASMEGLSGADVEVCVFDSGQMVRCRTFANALL